MMPPIVPGGDWVMPRAPLFYVRICINKRMNTDRIASCAARGSRGLADRLETLIAAEGLPAELLRGPCMNNCQIGPNIKIQAGPMFNLKEDISDARVDEIMAAIPGRSRSGESHSRS